MPFKIIQTDRYKRRLIKFLKANPQLKRQYYKTVELLEAAPFHPSLRLHKLSGRLEGLHSVSINRQYRLTLEFLIEDECIILIDIGTHDRVY